MRLILPFLLFAIGCGPVAVTNRQSRPDVVSADALAMSYRGRQSVYTDRTVQVALRSYTVKKGYVEAVLCESEAMLRFEVPAAPSEGKTLIVTGRCVGVVRDGVIRCGVDWHVRIESCTVTEVTP